MFQIIINYSKDAVLSLACMSHLCGNNYFWLFFLCVVGPALLVLGEEARENGLKYSLLERLCHLYMSLGDAALEHMVTLRNNYRCHADIMQLPNRLFYGNTIEPHALDAQLHPDFQYPLVFCVFEFELRSRLQAGSKDCLRTVAIGCRPLAYQAMGGTRFD